MRWAYEGVIFEPSGVDHQSPGSSFVVGGQMVEEVFGGTQPIGPMYAFVGISGMAKMSSSQGRRAHPGRRAGDHGAAAAALALRAPQAEPVLQVAFDQEIQRLYDEWDALVAQGRRRYGAAGGRWRPTPGPRPRRPGRCPPTPRPLPYRTLASVVDITAGDDEQTLRILCDLDPEPAGRARWTRLRPRLDLRRALDRHPGAGRAAHPRADRAGHRAARLAGRAGARVAAAAGRRPGGRTGRWTGSRRWSTACRRSRPACRRTPRRPRRS